jgi:hypothetical protein
LNWQVKARNKVRRSVQPLAFYGRARTRPGERLEDVVDLLVEDVFLAVDAVTVNGKQDSDAVPGPGRDLGRVSTAIQPQ